MAELQPDFEPVASEEPWATVTTESDARVELAVIKDPTPEERQVEARQAMKSGAATDLGRVAITLPETFEARVWLPDVPIELAMAVRMDGDRVVCDTLTMTSRDAPIETELLRKVPVAFALRLAATAALGMSGEGWADLLHLEQIDTDQGPTAEVLTAVAAVYSVAYAVGDRPTKAVGQALGVPRTTATGWVAAARRKGLLGQTAPRQQGVGS